MHVIICKPIKTPKQAKLKTLHLSFPRIPNLTITTRYNTGKIVILLSLNFKTPEKGKQNANKKIFCSIVKPNENKIKSAANKRPVENPYELKNKQFANKTILTIKNSIISNFLVFV